MKLNNQYKKVHFDRLNPEKGSKEFWKRCKPYFSNKDFFGESKTVLGTIQESLHRGRGEGGPHN